LYKENKNFINICDGVSVEHFLYVLKLYRWKLLFSEKVNQVIFMLKMLFVLLCIMSLRFVGLMPESYPLIIDHDNGIDDVISVILQCLNDAERVKAITIAPADCYPKPAAFVMVRMKNFFLPSDKKIPLGISFNEGINPFPNIWRDDAWSLTRLSLWQDEQALADFSLNAIQSSFDVLSKVLAESKSHIDILETGPCTNLAEIFCVHPEYKEKVHRIYIMGGAVYVWGNVEQKGHDGSAEWNIFNNPQAFLDVLRTGIPITLVSLDATQYTPIRQQFMIELEKRVSSKSCQLVYESLNLIRPLIDCGQYMFWDTLTSMVAINPDLVKTKKVKINVILDGPSMGRTIEDEHGYEVDVAIWADQDLFEKTVLNILSKG